MSSARPRPSPRPAYLLLAILLLILPAPPRAQQEPLPAPAEPYVVRVELIQVFVTVVDRAGDPVTDLTAGDFELREDGRPQEIVVFEPPGHRAPPGAAAPPGEPAAPATAAPPAAEPSSRPGEREARTYIVVFDGTNNPSGLRFKSAKDAMVRFVEERFGAGDRMAVVEMRPQLRVLCDLCESRDKVIDAIRSAAFLPGSGGQELLPLITNTITGTAIRSGERALQQLENLARFNEMLERSGQREFYDNLSALAKGVSRLPGRKYLLLFSGGFPFLRATEQIYGFIDPIPGPFRDLVNGMARTNTAIYTLDIGDEAVVADVERGDNLRLQMARVGIDENTLEYLGLDSIAYGGDPMLSRQTLAVLAGETGGRFVTDRNYDRALASIDRELLAAYTLGYYPREAREDGRFRRIEVSVKGRPLLEVQHRTGYFSPKPYRAMDPEERQAQLADAALGRVQRRDLPLASGIGFLPGESGDTMAAITLDVPLRGLERRPEEDGGGYVLDVVLTANDASGRQVDSISKQVEARPDPSNPPPPDGGLRLVEALTLPPGSGQVRLVVRDHQRGSTTTQQQELQVPDYRYDRLAVTSLHLMTGGGDYQVVDADFTPPSLRERLGREARRRPAGAAPPAAPEVPDPFRLPDGSTFVPTPRRTFRSGEELFVFMQILNLGYSEEIRGPLLGVTFDLRENATGTVRLPSRQEALVVDGAPGRPCTLVYRLGLDGVEPGDYALRVTVLDKAANAAVQGAEPIRIEGASPPDAAARTPDAAEGGDLTVPRPRGM
jgi:VWFA-related protein